MSKIKSNKRVEVNEQLPSERVKNFNEVCIGYDDSKAITEAKRCLQCKNPQCVKGCPVEIDIPMFIKYIKEENFYEAAKEIAKYSTLPAICGRVCPQEKQCEGKCVRGVKGDAIAIGKLEKFIADWVLENSIDVIEKSESLGRKVAVIGSGPSGLTCAGELARLGYDVTIYEALHKAGGVLVYGIPEFRLPKEKVVQREIENIKRLGVKIETNVVIGRTITLEKLIESEKFRAVFIGTGAGLPKFMNIPGENYNGVFSANEFLTRVNLMKAYDENYETPISIGEKVAVVGGGNVAMDAARVSIRLGSETHIVYRRGLDELPARKEEVNHAQEEGVIFDLLTNPIEIIGDEKGNVKGMKCLKMELKDDLTGGRRKPVAIEGSDFIMDIDTVIMSLGTIANPFVATTINGIEIDKKRCIVIEEDTGKTTKDGIYAGGDVVTGAATVILAMGAGKRAAKSINEYLIKETN